VQHEAQSVEQTIYDETGNGAITRTDGGGAVFFLPDQIWKGGALRILLSQYRTGLQI
jgi:hypothetical protein